MLDKQTVADKMTERGYTLYANMGKTQMQFISSHMYRLTPINKPIINVLIDLEKNQFKGTYCINRSINTIDTPWCGPVLDDGHFDKIISPLLEQAACLEEYLERHKALLKYDREVREIDDMLG